MVDKLLLSWLKQIKTLLKLATSPRPAWAYKVTSKLEQSPVSKERYKMLWSVSLTHSFLSLLKLLSSHSLTLLYFLAGAFHSLASLYIYYYGFFFRLWVGTLLILPISPSFPVPGLQLELKVHT